MLQYTVCQVYYLMNLQFFNNMDATPMRKIEH